PTSAEAAGPTMPIGLLAPSPLEKGQSDAGPRPAARSASPAERLTMLRGAVKDSGWIELQLGHANDGPGRSSFERGQATSSFVSVDVMTLLHEPFARALPGFDLFVPRLFDGEALGRLVTELTTLREQLGTMSSVSAARSRWGEVSTLVAELPDDAAWLDA